MTNADTLVIREYKMSNVQAAVVLIQQAMALLGGSAAPDGKKKRVGKKGGNKGLIRLDLQRKLVLKEMIAEWEKLPKAKREEKTTDTHTTKGGKEVTREVFVHPQPNYRDAISECKRRKDAGKELPEVSEEDVEAAWAAQQEKAGSGSEVESSEVEAESAEEEEAAPAPAPAPVPAPKKAGRPKKAAAESEAEAEAEAVVEEAKAAAKKPVKKAKA